MLFPEAILLVIQGPNQGRRFEIGDEAVSLGRGATNAVRILDTEASRRHAQISYENGRWRISDLGSSNGTYLNGRAIDSAILEAGDQIQLGRTVLLFQMDAAPRPTAPVERISLIARTELEDQSRIVGRAPWQDTVSLSGWPQAGANLQLLYEITEESVRPTTSLDELLKRILDLTLRAVRADRGCMLVSDSKTDRITPRVVSHRPGIDVGERMPISTSIVEYVIQKGQGVRTSDAQHDSRFADGPSILQSGIREAMCVPMQGRYELMGVIYVDTTSSPIFSRANGQFSDALLRLLVAIGRQTALAIENYRYQDALVMSERLAAVGQTVAILSHHIKNIMQGVQGGSYLVQQGLAADNRALIQQGWDVVQRNQQRIYNLAMDMLAFSKERQPKLSLNDLGALITDVIEVVQSRAERAGIALQVRELSPAPRSMFDAEGLHRAVLNVLTNAVEALEEHAQPRLDIRYGFDPAREHLWVEVEDNGPGIAEADLPRLFNLFESNKGAKGTGLGLAVSKKILQEHGGALTVRTALDEGTCFRLEWPWLVDEGESSDEIPVRE